MNDTDAGDPFESGNALTKKNFDKYWFQILSVFLLSVIVIAFCAWLFLRKS